jgi:glycerol-3-phosphate O-acyltransferase
MLSQHHIYSRISKALFNGIVLCHECHAVADSFNRITGIKGTKVRRDLLFLTLTALYRNRYYIDNMPKIEQKRVKEFIEIIHDDIKVVLKNIR